MIVARGLGKPGLPLATAGLGLAGEYIMPPVPPQLYGFGGAPDEEPQKRARAAFRNQLLREDRELLEIVSLLVLRVLE